jgi:hypothetical protein
MVLTLLRNLLFKFSHFSTCHRVENYIITYKFESRACTTSSERPPKFLRIVHIFAYHVYYDFYKIDRNKQSKITVHETDILYNSHSTKQFYRQSRLTAVEQITFHDTKIKHLTFHANKYWPFTAHENTLSHPPCSKLVNKVWQFRYISLSNTLSATSLWQAC